jgi:uncharacterized membrane protein
MWATVIVNALVVLFALFLYGVLIGAAGWMGALFGGLLLGFLIVIPLLIIFLTLAGFANRIGALILVAGVLEVIFEAIPILSLILGLGLILVAVRVFK